MTAATFTFEVKSGQNGPAIVAVTGEVDATNATKFASAMAEVPGPRPIVLDLSDLDYLDSAGLATLDRLSGARSITVVIPPTSPLFRAAELMELPCHHTLEEAFTNLT